MSAPWPWLAAADAPPLAARELRLYWCDSTGPDGSRRERIDRLLRTALAPLLGSDAQDLLFGRESKGRPFLRHEQAPDFNLSDTDGGTLLAICQAGRIGVDLERIDRQPPVQRLAQRWFAAGEAQALQRLDPETARRSFLNLWTAKEASCKATGTGIYGYLSKWHFDAHSPAPLLQALPGNAGDAAHWRFQRLAPSPDHTAVIAMYGVPDPTIRGYRLAF